MTLNEIVRKAFFLGVRREQLSANPDAICSKEWDDLHDQLDQLDELLEMVKSYEID